MKDESPKPAPFGEWVNLQAHLCICNHFLLWRRGILENCCKIGVLFTVFLRDYERTPSFHFIVGKLTSSSSDATAAQPLRLPLVLSSHLVVPCFLPSFLPSVVDSFPGNKMGNLAKLASCRSIVCHSLSSSALGLPASPILIIVVRKSHRPIGDSTLTLLSLPR